MNDAGDASDADDERDDDAAGWVEFYEAMRGRKTRAPFDEAVALAEQRAGGPGQAADIGCGEGAETHALLRRGWRVVAVDRVAAAADFLRARLDPALAPRLQWQTAPFVAMRLPPLQLAWAGMALPFAGPHDFAAVWQRIADALRPGAVFGGHFFGPRDSWADPASAPTGALAIHDADTVRALLAGFETAVLREREWDGGSGAGPKHWHLFEVVACRR